MKVTLGLSVGSSSFEIVVAFAAAVVAAAAAAVDVLSSALEHHIFFSRSPVSLFVTPAHFVSFPTLSHFFFFEKLYSFRTC